MKNLLRFVKNTLKNQFCDGEIDILIVCSKLLTGYNAPRTQVLYIDKELKEHNLLQAIARTNRIHEGKDFGLIVDYRGLIDKLDSAMEVYSGAGLENYDSADIKGVIVDVMSCVARLREMVSRWGSCSPKKGFVTFNTALVAMPVSCIEYVVMHEFTHFLFPNHSKNFYQQLRIFMPDWEERKKRLEGEC